jgi:multimeric flavodoxin WrbA
MPQILIINGSYRDNGVTDQALNLMTEALQKAGANSETILLRDYPIEFCLNCRECTQQPGVAPGKCIQHDGMQALVDKIEAADAYIFASPTNFGSVTAVFKRFMERLTVYAYWHWGMHAPQMRKAKAPQKKAVLVSSCAAPGLLGRWVYGTHSQLKQTAQIIGAASVGSLFTGLVSQEPHLALPDSVQRKAKALALKLL